MGFATQLYLTPTMSPAEYKRGKEAVNLAYDDAKAAFEFFLANRPDKTRPYIIAAHSQGSLLMAKVISECVQGHDQASCFVAAYLAGGYVNTDLFNTKLKAVHPCRGPTDSNCVISWDTRVQGIWEPKSMQAWPLALYPNVMYWVLFDEYCGPRPEGSDDSKERLQINPMTWTNKVSENGGAYLGAKVHGSVEPAMPTGPEQWDSTKTKVDNHYVLVELPNWWSQLPGPAKAVGNLHPGDLQLFFYNIKSNVKERLAAFN